MNDLISRIMAVEAIRRLRGEIHTYPSDGCKKILIDKAEAQTELMLLPPAQPEILRCKDCKHHWTHKCMDSMPIERCDLEQTFYDAEVDYCSLAERRTDERFNQQESGD